MLTLRTLAGSPPSPRTIESQDGVVGGQAGDPGALALELARSRDLRLGDDGGQRALHDGHDPDDVAPLLAGEGEIVDVEDRELRAAGEQELDAVGRGGRRRDAEVDALGAVEVALQGQVDAGVHRVGLEVQDQPGGLVGAALGAVRAAGDDERARRSRERRGARWRAIGAGSIAAVAAGRRSRACRVSCGAAPRHLLAQRHALAVAHVPVLLQVLRLRDAPPAPARARRGRRRCSTTRRGGGSRSCSSSPARRPTITRGCASASSAWGFEDFTAYVVWACQQGARARAAAAHQPRRASAAAISARLREVTASQGLMLESVNPDLVAHQGSPTKQPERAWPPSAPPASCGSRSPAASSSASASPRTTGWPRWRRWRRCTPSTVTCRR